MAATRNGLIHALRWLRGRPISRVHATDDTAVIAIETESIEMDLTVLALFRDMKTRQALGGRITRPLARPGVDSFSCGAEGDVFETVSKAEAYCFIVPDEGDEALGETTFTEAVQIVRLEFNQENKWRFTNGDHTFYAPILDEVFLRSRTCKIRFCRNGPDDGAVWCRRNAHFSQVCGARVKVEG